MPTLRWPGPAPANPAASERCTPPAPGKRARLRAALEPKPTAHLHTRGTRTPRASHGRSRPPRPQGAQRPGPRVRGPVQHRCCPAAWSRRAPRAPPLPGRARPAVCPRPKPPDPQRVQQPRPTPNWTGSGRRTCWTLGAGRRRRPPRRGWARSQDSRKRGCQQPRLRCSLPGASTRPDTPPDRPKPPPSGPLPAGSPAPTGPWQPPGLSPSAGAASTPAGAIRKLDLVSSGWNDRGGQRPAVGERCLQRLRRGVRCGPRSRQEPR
mmetsp:Transcript_59813/g.138338  ORF Transcript_59813/g.138338 Transcript_59813/m.138338 type:complete len:265 (+) Transcript_59813:475-1269(+)